MSRARRGFIAVGAALVVGAVLVVVATRLREPDAGLTLPPGVPGRLVDVHGRRVHVVEAGSGAPLLLVHGFGGSTHDFEEFVLEPLAASHRVIAVDLFGFGWSGRSDDFRYGWALWAGQLAATMDVLGVERASLAGHSMGGAVAAYFAATHPTRIDRLVLADALYPAESGETPLVFWALYTPGVGETILALVDEASAPGFSPAYRARARAWYRIQGTRRAALRYVRDSGKFDELARVYPSISAPTLVLHGTDDESVPYASMQRAVASIPDRRVVPIRGGRHFLLRDTPEIFVRQVQEHLAGR